MKKQKKSGFTMVELLVAMAIMGLLIATAIWGIGTAQQSARNTQRRTMGANILAGLSEYYSRYNKQAVSVCGVPAVAGGFAGCIVMTNASSCTGVTVSTCTSAPTSGIYYIPTSGANAPATSGSLELASPGTAYLTDGSTATYIVDPTYVSGQTKGYQVCTYLEGGGVANLSEPQSIICP